MSKAQEALDLYTEAQPFSKIDWERKVIAFSGIQNKIAFNDKKLG